MQIVINYGDDKLTLNVPDNIRLDEYTSAKVENNISFDDFKMALSDTENNLFPIETADLFVVNDAYRPTPTAQILKWIDTLGKLNKRATFLVATGCHQAPTEKQLKTIFGELYPSVVDRIVVHNAHDKNNLVKIGPDNFDQPVLINKLFHTAKNIVVIGSVEPHYFAGFTGGRKSIFPGLCDFETTARNHNLAVSLEASPMKLEGNPVAEHLQILMNLLPKKFNNSIFGIQTVLNCDKTIAGLFCGKLGESFELACRCASEIFRVETEDKYDLLLAETRPPLDSSLYQLQKSLENCQSAISDNGTVILFSPCQEGIGGADFYDLADHWTPNDDGSTSNGTIFGSHKLSRVYDMSHRFNIRLYSKLNDGVSDKVFFNTESTPQKTINDLCNTKENLKVCLVHDAGHTVLINRT